MTETRSIPLTAIIDSDRLRPADPAWVEALAAAIGERGLKQAIIVRPIAGETARYKLVAGKHRLEAVRLLGWASITASVEQMTDDEAQLVEIDENLIRRELSPLDRAIFLAQRKAVWERMHPQTKNGGDRKSRAKQGENQIANIANRFSKDVAEKVGLSERTIQLACRIAAELGADLADLRGTALADNQAQLLALARLPADARRRTIEAALASRHIRTVSAALRATAAPQAKDLDEVNFRKLADLWSRASAKVRRRFLNHIGVDETAVQTKKTA